MTRCPGVGSEKMRNRCHDPFQPDETSRERTDEPNQPVPATPKSARLAPLPKPTRPMMNPAHIPAVHPVFAILIGGSEVDIDRVTSGSTRRKVKPKKQAAGRRREREGGGRAKSVATLFRVLLTCVGSIASTVDDYTSKSACGAGRRTNDKRRSSEFRRGLSRCQQQRSIQRRGTCPFQSDRSRRHG